MLKTASYVFVGNTIIAIAVRAFVIPVGLVMGGATGIGLTVNHYMPELELSTIIFVCNAILFLLGAIVLGKKFALKTVLSTIFYPVMLEVVGRIPGIGAITDNALLAVVYAGILLGFGIGIIMRAGASTGGSDIVALVLSKGTRIKVAICMYIVDFIIIGLQIPISTGEEVLYGILALIISTIVLGRVVVLGQSQIQLFIVSKKHQEIRCRLLEDVDVGVTLLHIETGLESREQNAVLCVIPNRKLHDINKMIQEIDAKAFMTISQIHEVKGRGFTLERIDKVRKV